MTFQIYIGVAIVILVVLYFSLKKIWREPSSSAVPDAKAPTVSEDVNLPMQMQKSESSAPSQTEPNPQPTPTDQNNPNNPV